MKSRIHPIIAQSLLLCLSLAFMSTVHAQKVAVTEADPNVAEQETLNLDVKIKGRGFASGAAVKFWVTGSTTNNGGVTVNSAVVHDSKNLTANIDVPLGATISDYDIEVAVSSSRRGRGTTLFSVKQKPGGQTADTTPPGPVEDQLYTQTHTESSMVLHWKAPGDDGALTGTVDHYDIRGSAQGASCPASPAGSEWTASDFNWINDFDITLNYNGSQIGKNPYPAEASEFVLVWGLESEICYVFEFEAFDEAGNRSGTTYTTGTTRVQIGDSAWGAPEIVVAELDYRNFQSLAFDPTDGRPAFLISDEGADNTRYEKMSADGTWTEEIIESSKCKRGAELSFHPSSIRAEGLLVKCQSTSGRGKRTVQWSFFDRLSADNWVEGLAVPEDYLPEATQQGGNWRFSYDTNDLRVFAFDQDQSIQLVNLDQDPLNPEVVASEGRLTDLSFDPISGYPAVAYLAPDPSTGGRIGTLAEFNGSGWIPDVVKVESPDYTEFDQFVVDFDPNGAPLVMYRNAPSLKMARRDNSGGWVETIIPRIIPNQMGAIYTLQYRADGTAFVMLVNGEGEIYVGRFCEIGHDFTCESVWTDLDEWVIERVYAPIGRTLDSASFALDLDGLPAVGLSDGGLSPAGLTTIMFARCRPGISQVCEPLLPPSP